MIKFIKFDHGFRIDPSIKEINKFLVTLKDEDFLCGVSNDNFTGIFYKSSDKQLQQKEIKN